MRLTARQLNRAVLDRQGLLARSAASVESMIGQVLALQAQEPAAPYVALWNRIEGFDPVELDRAYADRRVVKAPLMRVTLHAVSAQDYGALRPAMFPVLSAARLNDRRFNDTGFTRDEGLSLAKSVVEFADGPRTKDQLLAHLSSVDDRGPQAWWALRTISRLIHSPNQVADALWSFGHRPVFEAAPAGAPDGDGELGFDDALRELVRRYLLAFGPARARDLARFSLHKVSTIRDALDSMPDELRWHEGPDGDEYVDVAGARSIPADDMPAPARLMGMWDSVLLAHADTDRVMTEHHRAHVVRRNGDTLATVLVDGKVKGAWRAIDGGIEVTPFERWPESTWDELGQEAESIGRTLVSRDPDLFGRYGRWWDQLPTDDRRLLPY